MKDPLENMSSECRDGLRQYRLITRDIPTIELENVLVNFGWVVEYSNGIMLVTKPK